MGQLWLRFEPLMDGHLITGYAPQYAVLLCTLRHAPPLFADIWLFEGNQSNPFSVTRVNTRCISNKRQHEPPQNNVHLEFSRSPQSIWISRYLILFLLPHFPIVKDVFFSLAGQISFLRGICRNIIWGVTASLLLRALSSTPGLSLTSVR